jgi:pentatricopeptide repeat protein
MAGESDSAEKSKWLITHQRRGDGKTAKELYAEMEEYGVVPPDDLGYAYEKDTDGDIWTS